MQISATAAHILERNPQAAQQGLLTDFMGQQEFTREISLSNAKPSHQLPYFYALIAMVCLYGSFQGLTSAFYLQANLSALGARRSMAPRKKPVSYTHLSIGKTVPGRRPGAEVSGEIWLQLCLQGKKRQDPGGGFPPCLPEGGNFIFHDGNYQGLPGTLRSGADQPVLARTSPGGKNERKPVIRLMGKIPAGSFSGGKRRTERNGLKNSSK